MTILDAVVVGAGPAGASCALWLHRLGARVLVLDGAPQVGGLLASSRFPNEWNVSLGSAATGQQCARDMAQALDRNSVPVELGRMVTLRSVCDGVIATDQRDAWAVRARYAVIATGTRPVDGGLASNGRVHIGLASFATVAATTVEGKDIAVLGGGDTAIEAAMLALNHRAASVTVYARSGIGHGHLPAAHIAGADIVVGPVDVDVHRLSVNRRPFDRIVVAYGFAANLDVLDSLLRARVRTADGRVQVTPDQCCGPSRLFAAGDITNAMHPCSVTAMAQGIVAAKAIASRLSAESLTSRASAVA